jgi:hypothetical protein
MLPPMNKVSALVKARGVVVHIKVVIVSAYDGQYQSAI